MLQADDGGGDGSGVCGGGDPHGGVCAGVEMAVAMAAAMAVVAAMAGDCHGGGGVGRRLRRDGGGNGGCPLHQPWRPVVNCAPLGIHRPGEGAVKWEDLP